MRNIHPSPLLKGALRVDALVSGGVAALQLLGGQSLASWLVLPQPLLTATGAFLVGYAVVLLVLARSTSVASPLIWVIVLGNVGWAFACIALLAIGPRVTGSIGTLFVLVQATAVLVFAAMEYKGMRTSESGKSLHSGLARSTAAR